MNALLDKEFLRELDYSINKETYARITALDINDYPLELIEGKATGGSINIDGASALRRTCSVSLIAEDVNINEFYWGLNNKFKLEIGIKNTINADYPEIIWFPQGVYIITSFNCNLSTNNFTISINGKDKMCRLNGEFGGSLPASIDFGTEDYYDLSTGTLTRTNLPIKRIIREMVHTYAEEPYHNIIINDIDDNGLELLEYRGSTPMYLLYDIEQSEYTQMYFDGKQECIIVDKDDNSIGDCTLETIPVYNERIADLEYMEGTKIKLSEDENSSIYTVSKVEYGQTAGYRLTELTYAGDLISGIGESVTSILDKIVSMLGNFEYFYDLSGRFVFQAKKTYLNVAWNSIVENKDDKDREDIHVENAAYADKYTYYFNGNNLIKSISNTPDLTKVKNDYVIWGSRKGISGAEIPIHMRYAIHKKPTKYVSYDGTIEYTTDKYDWRELIYQMALDYYKHNQEDEYLITIAEKNPEYPTGVTGYETFYTDFQAFWRDLYNPFDVENYEVYNYEYDDIQTFTPLDNSGAIDLYVNEQYVKYDKENDSLENRKKALVLTNEYGSNEWGLYNLIDTIKLIKEYNEKGESLYYFIPYINSDGERKYKPITQNTMKSVRKDSIYVPVEGKDEEYELLLASISVGDNWYIREESGKIKVKDIQDENIKSLYYEEKDKYKKYYVKYTLDLYGSSTNKTEQVYFKYYKNMEKYYAEIKGDLNPLLLYWNKNVYENPDLLNFWIDFLDVSDVEEDRSELGKMAISVIGDRPKVVNEKNVKSIYYRNIPNLIFYSGNVSLDVINENSGYIFMNLPGEFNMDCFTISAQGRSAKDTLNDLLYQHSYCSESISAQSLPIYYLEPNTMISIEDKDTNINGEYILNKITLPLTYNGMMSIQATKSPQRIY